MFIFGDLNYRVAEGFEIQEVSRQGQGPHPFHSTPLLSDTDTASLNVSVSLSASASPSVCLSLCLLVQVYDVLEMSPGSLMSELNSVLLAQDQLSIEKSERRAFHDFQEAPIAFKPTYQVVTSPPPLSLRAPFSCPCPCYGCDMMCLLLADSLFLSHTHSL